MVDITVFSWPLVSGEVSKTVDPLSTETVPDGMPAPGATGFTVTTAVTGWPETDVNGEILTLIEVADWLMVCATGAEVLAP
jgi:hypothetical protein